MQMKSVAVGLLFGAALFGSASAAQSARDLLREATLDNNQSLRNLRKNQRDQ